MKFFEGMIGGFIVRCIDAGLWLFLQPVGSRFFFNRTLAAELSIDIREKGATLGLRWSYGFLCRVAEENKWR